MRKGIENRMVREDEEDDDEEDTTLEQEEKPKKKQDLFTIEANWSSSHVSFVVSSPDGAWTASEMQALIAWWEHIGKFRKEQPDNDAI